MVPDGSVAPVGERHDSSVSPVGANAPTTLSETGPVVVRRHRSSVGLLQRGHLVDLVAGSPARVVAIVAGPGYGKSTLLDQWADQLASAAVWHACTDGDNDPAVLLSALGDAAGAEPGIVTVAGLVAALRRQPSRTLLLDDLQAITRAGSLNVLTDVIDRLPDAWRVGFASRARPRLPIARLRAAGELLEIGVSELCLLPDEEAEVLGRSGVRLSPTAATALHDHTEGWPVGVRLAGMALRAQGGHNDESLTFTGDDRFMREYLLTEVLGGVRVRENALLVRCSILGDLSGPVCDAVLRSHASGTALEHLETHGVIQAVDRDGERYRCHPLLHELLVAELHRKEPALVPELHRRAARWYEDAHLPEQAIEHAHRGGDHEELARLVLEWAQPTWRSGRIDTVQQWMSWLEEASDIDVFPAVAAHASLIFGLLGEVAGAQRWSAMAHTASGSGALPDGGTVEGTVAYLRAIEARDGTVQMRVDARAARAGLPSASPFRAAMFHTEGLAYLLEGDLDRADDLFVEAIESAELARAEPVVAMDLCERAAVAVERGDWDAAVASVRRASTIVADGGYESYWTSALVHAWAGRTAVHLGLRTEAVQHTRNALALRPLLTHAIPVVSTQALLTTAQASLGLGDLHAASATVRQAQEIMRRRPGLGDLPDRVAALGATVHEATFGGHSDKLTPAEVRLMPLLATHLTFPLIAERLGVSRNTVKTQAISSYRKLGVSSRSEAVARWELLDGTAGS